MDKNLHVLFAMNRPSLTAIEEFEDKIGVVAPIEYKTFLSEYNAYIIRENTFRLNDRSYAVQCFYPFSTDFKISLQRVYDQLYDCFLGKFIPFASDPGVWQFVISLRKEDYGCIYFCRMDEEIPEALTYLASSFNSFLENLTEE